MTASVLSRKLRHSGIARSPLAETDIIVEAFARGVEDRMRSLVKTMTAVSVDAVGVTKLSEATRRVQAPAVFGLVEVEDADTHALIACDGALANHLVDLTLGGDPAMPGAAEARSFTPIDMALCRLHLEAIVQAFGQAMGVGFGRPLTKTLRIRDQRQSLAQLRLAPDYIDVLSFSMGIRLGEAARTGRVEFVLPLSALDVIRASIQVRNQQEARERPNDLWRTLMRRAAAAAPVRVDAVLHRQSLSLAALQALQVGQVLEIPRQAVEEIRLTIPQPAGRTAVLALGHLGAYQDRKVVKLATTPDARVRIHIERALHPTGIVPSASPERAASAPAPVPSETPGAEAGPVAVAPQSAS